MIDTVYIWPAVHHYQRKCVLLLCLIASHVMLVHFRHFGQMLFAVPIVTQLT